MTHADVRVYDEARIRVRMDLDLSVEGARDFLKEVERGDLAIRLAANLKGAIAAADSRRLRARFE